MTEEIEDPLKKLGGLLSQPGFRRAFADDPLSALTSNQLSAGDIPQPVLDTLAEMTPAELRVLSEVKVALQDAGIELSIIAEMV